MQGQSPFVMLGTVDAVASGQAKVQCVTVGCECSLQHYVPRYSRSGSVVTSYLRTPLTMQGEECKVVARNTWNVKPVGYRSSINSGLTVNGESVHTVAPNGDVLRNGVVVKPVADIALDIYSDPIRPLERIVHPEDPIFTPEQKAFLTRNQMLAQVGRHWDRMPERRHNFPPDVLAIRNTARALIIAAVLLLSLVLVLFAAA